MIYLVQVCEGGGKYWCDKAKNISSYGRKVAKYLAKLFAGL